jgi:ubiquitin C-terminal hydrolase
VFSFFTAKKQNQRQMSFLRLPNSDGKSCYANSIVQALLQMKALTDLLDSEQDFLSVEISQLRSQLTTKSQQSKYGTKMLRQLVGEEFRKDEQQDVHEFFIKLFMRLPDSARRLFEFERHYTSRCRKCLKLTSRTSQTVHCYETYPNANDKFSNLFPKSDFVFGVECPQCGKISTQDKSMKIQLGAEQKYLVVLLNLFTFNKKDKKPQRISDRIIDGFNSANNVRLFGKTFSTIAAIRHQGETTKEGHYTCCIRSNNGWFEISDSIVTDFISQRFVQKLSNVYMLFLEIV